MQVLFLVELLCFLLFVAYLVYSYSAKSVPLYVLFFVYTSWLLSFSIVIILPLDIYYSVVIEDSDTRKVYHNVIYDIWILIYWTNFLYCWGALPIFQEYEDAGELTSKDKLKRSLKNNLIFYGVLGVLGIIFIVYLKYTSHMTESNILGFLIAMANCFGICLIIVLLGYGLVTIPRNLWRMGNQELTLKYYQFQAALVEETKASTEYELSETIKKAYALSSRDFKNPTFNLYLKTIMKLIPEDMLQECQNLLKSSDIREICDEFGALNEGKLAGLHKQVKKGMEEHKRAETCWEDVLENAFLMEDILENRNSNDHKMRSTFWIERNGGCNNAIDTFLWFWHVKIKHRVARILAVVIAGLSVIVVIGEITIFSDLKILEFTDFTTIGQGFFLTQIMTLIPLCYLAFAVNVGLFNMKLSGFFGLYKDHQTDAPSLLFSSINFARVSAPLCFNFLNMIKVHNTAFNKVMGEINIVPIFGSGFTSVFPITLIILCLFNIYDVYGRFLSYLGLKQFQFAENFNDEKIHEGKQLLYKARVIRERRFLNLNSTNLKNFHGYTSRVLETSFNNNYLGFGEEMRLKDNYDLESNMGFDSKINDYKSNIFKDQNGNSRSRSPLEKYRKK